MDLIQFYQRLGLFFEERATLFLNKPRLARRDLCYIGGKDYRLWTDELYEDLVDTLTERLDLNPSVSLLEVGCAAGLLAEGFSKRVGTFVGIDLSPACIRLAKKQKIPNASFRVADGLATPFEDASFDRVFCYDVVTNQPNLEAVERLVREMARITRPGGRFLVDSIFNPETEADFPRHIAEVDQTLPEFIPDPDIASRRWVPWRYKFLKWFNEKVLRITPEPLAISNYYHPADFFTDLAAGLGVRVEILPLHSRHPYRDYRYSALYYK